MMRLSFAVALSFLSTTPAAAQTVVLVIEAGPTRVDADALRREVAEASGREVVALSDTRAAGARESVSAAGSPDGRLWVLRYDRDGHTAWRTTEAATLARAIGELLASDWTHANGDVLDPWRWDPLRAALRLELMEPFARRTRYAWAELVDPFVAPDAWVDVLDPWSP